MTELIFALVLLMLLVVYYFSKKKTTSRVYVQCVEAGPTSEVNAAELKRRSYYDKDIVMRGLNGEILPSSRFARILVSGTCMTKRKILDGDILIAETFNENTDFKRELSKGDIVWIYIPDTGMDKIRIVDNWSADGEMKTYYYKDGKKQMSSKNHSVSQIKGIVRYNINAHKAN